MKKVIITKQQVEDLKSKYDKNDIGIVLLNDDGGAIEMYVYHTFNRKDPYDYIGADNLSIFPMGSKVWKEKAKTYNEVEADLLEGIAFLKERAIQFSK